MFDAEGPKVRAPVVWRLRPALDGGEGAEANDHVHINPDRELSVRVVKKTVVSWPLSNGTCDAHRGA